MARPLTTMTSHKCEPLTSVDGSENVILKNFTPEPTQMAMFTANNGAVPAGRIWSENASSGNIELGVDGSRVAYINRRSTGNPSTGFYTDDASAQNAVHVTAKNGFEHKVACYALFQGMEFSTTEFRTDLTYAINEYLRAPDATALSNVTADIVAYGGVLTNATVQYGKHAIVGVVSKVKYKNEHNVWALNFYALYAPPIQNLTTSLITAINT